jgi:hypothetical protein
MDSMPPCPYTKRGQHAINVIMPEHDDRPVLLFCSVCGMTKRQTMDVPLPMDDLPADAIARLAR